MNSSITSTPQTVLNEAGCFPFNVGLLPETVRALQVIAKKHKMKKRGWPSECWAGLFAIKFALANPQKFSEWLDAVSKYKELEGLNYDSCASQLVNRHKEYRKKPLPTNWLPFEK